MGVRERMPRQSLSVILRGWHPLVTNQTEKSAIAVYWETASQSVPGSWCHPRASPFQGSLPRCQCIGRRPADCHCYLATLHISLQSVYMHRPPINLRPCTTCAPYFASHIHFGGPKKSTRRILIKIHPRMRSAPKPPERSKSEYGILNFRTV